ncbi:adenosylcobinamide-phosphate synthase CbiB [Chitinophaga rhizophila]|uniref:Cobalamin biosynthesis protein CobD n=1 Tax=Chitinophaga rhizophila TaxID=2866212 RepID=A0ABS7GIC6_9BACT|nr:adenosylcobinamide-phosphate synthase CbiB [Chitinophaga rhizophila]MBW8687076.1 adenosylcobinamide-phosphate synthase CbiB [Chitinophaga rhizophila]
MDQQFLLIAVPLLAGYILDLLLGDPRWLPHPIRLFGNTIDRGTKALNSGQHRFVKGMLMTVVLCSTTWLFFYTVQYYLLQTGTPVWYYLFSSIFVFYGLANRSLLQEGREVFDTLAHQGLEAGRKRLSWIVGRETTHLNENQIRTAVFETLSENLSDGVIAPLFYYAIGGVPAMMTYKMINTLDSMIGYKKEQYFWFGKFAARLDDVANYVPARITAFLMIVVTFSKRGWMYILRYGHQHASPNSGYPEAALAGIMDLRFGGPNTYHGQVVVKPYIGTRARPIGHEEIGKVVWVNHGVTLVSVIVILVVNAIVVISPKTTTFATVLGF